MKKFTLLAGLALVAGSAYAEQVNRLEISNPETNDMHYYRISNMRVQRLSYLTQDVYDQYGYEEDNIIGQDVATLTLPEYLPGKCEADGEEAKTPEIFTGNYKYMGLSNYDNQWWLAFSSIDEIVNPNTRFWYFTKGKTEGTVLIHNAVQQGSVKRNPNTVTTIVGTSYKNMAFDTKDNQYFVLPVREMIEEQEFDISLDPDQLDLAFALSTSRTVTTESSTALDCSNYVTRTMKSPQLDEVGDTLFDDESGDTLYNYYGFVGADRTWSPIRQAGGENRNHEINNGSLWFVEPAATADAEAAIAAYAQVIIDSYRKTAEAKGAEIYAAAANELKAYTNLPALIKDQTALQAIIARFANPTQDVSGIKSLADVDNYLEQATANVEKARVEVAGLIGYGAIVRFKQMLAIRDYPAMDEALNIDGDQEKVDTLALGDAWIAAGQKGWFNNGGERAVTGYPAIGPVIETTPDYDLEKTKWELIPIWNTNKFKLYNDATKSYIMAFNADTLKAMTTAIWEADPDLAGTMAEQNVGLFTWATTANADDAAEFELKPCPDAEAQAALNEEEEGYVLDYTIPTEITDNVRLVSVDPKTGYETNLHRATSGSEYKFENYTPTANRWYAESNIFHVEVVKAGGIDEIATPDAPKAQGIYDLQGRRVSKAGKGLYIINGVKTIVR